MSYWAELERIECGVCGRLAYATNSGIVCECRIADERERERCRHRLTAAALQFAQLRASYAGKGSGASSTSGGRYPYPPLLTAEEEALLTVEEEVRRWHRLANSGTT